MDMNPALTNQSGREIISTDKDLYRVNSPAPLLQSSDTNLPNTFSPPSFLSTENLLDASIHDCFCVHIPYIL